MYNFLNFIKCLGVDLTLATVIFTFTFSTYPRYSLAVDESSGVYKPGEEFNDALGKLNESGEGSGLMGMVEQFVGLGIAAAAISSLKFKYTEESLADCAQNKNANLTLRLLQAGGLAYLLGEIKAKAEFKKASKLATDAAFSVKQKEGEETEAGKEANQKQVEAYETLVKVYDHKIKGIKTKKNLAMLAELAYLGALGMEIIKTKPLKVMCETDRNNYSEAVSSLSPMLESLKGALDGEMNSMRGIECDNPGATPAAPICNAYPRFVACEMGKTNAEAYEEILAEQSYVGELEGERENIEANQDDVQDNDSIIKKFFNLKNIMIFLAAGAILKSVKAPKPQEKKTFRTQFEDNWEKFKDEFELIVSALRTNLKIMPEANAWVGVLRAGMKAYTRSGGGLSALPRSTSSALKDLYFRVIRPRATAARTWINGPGKTSTALVAGGATLIAGTVAVSDIALAEQQATIDQESRERERIAQALQADAERELLTAQAEAIRNDRDNLCNSTCNTCSGFQAVQTQYESAHNMPIRCCGVNLRAERPTAENRIPNNGVVDKTVDVIFEKLPLIGDVDQSIKKFMKPGILNLMEQKYFADYDVNDKNAEQILAEHNAFYQYLNHIEENFDEEILNNKTMKKYERVLANVDYNDDSSYESLLSKLKSELIIDDAKALDFSGLLGFGVKLFLVYKVTAKFFREKALNKPRNRMYTFGIIAAINAVIVIFQGKRLKDNEKQRDVIKAELEKFKESHALKTGLGLEDQKDGNGDLVNIVDNTLGSGVVSGPPTIACAVGSAGVSKFSPVPCPARPLGNISGIRKGDLSNSEAKASPLLSSLPGLINDATTAAASGVDQTNSKQFDATLGSATRNLAAVKKEIDRLAKDLDKVDPFIVKDKKGNNIVVGSLSGRLAGIDKAFKTPSNQSISDSALSTSDKASLNEILDTAEKSGQANGKPLATIPSGSGSSTSSGSDPFDFGTANNGGVIENFDQYKGDLDYAGQSKDLNYAKGEINQNENVSIFKVLNNRYLKSYDRLLTELPDREPERAPVPQE